MSEVKSAMLVVNDIEDLGIDQFRGQADSEQLRNGVVSFNGKTYQVRFLNGDIDVTRQRNTWKEKIRGWFQKNASHTETAQEIREQLMEQFRGKKILSHTVSNINKLFNKEFGNNATDKALEIVHYGFSPNRSKAQDAEAQFNNSEVNQGNRNKVHFNTIDTYNVHVGINWSEVNGRSLGIYIDDIKNQQLELWNDGVEERFPLHKLQEWQSHLNHNVDKLDIPKKLFTYMNSPQKPAGLQKKSGWEYEFAKNPDKALMKFIQKNIPLNASPAPGDLKLLTKLFKEYLTIYNTTQGEERREKIEAFYDKKLMGGDFQLGPDGENYSPVDLKRGCGGDVEYSTLTNLFDNVIRTAFFRQTSKLGLDFFREKKVPIIFQWSDWNGVTKNTSSSQAMGDLKNKWWLKDPSKFAKGQTGESITYSEARHLIKLNRMEQKGELEQKLNVKLSTGSRH